MKMLRANLKQVIFFSVYVSYAWSAIRYRQARELEAHQLKIQKSQQQQPPGQSLGISSPSSSRHSRCLSPKPDSNAVDEKRANTRRIGGDDLDFGLLPELGKVGLAYYCVSTCVNFVAFVWFSLFYDQITNTSGEHYFLSCIWPKLVIHERISQSVTMICCYNMCMLHPIWRCIMTVYARKRMTFEAIKFMLADEQMIEKVIHLTTPSKSTVCRASGTCDHGRRAGQSFTDDLQLMEAWQFRSLRDCMYYRLEKETGSTEYVLRPNRTIEAHRKLWRAVLLGLAVILIMYAISASYLSTNLVLTMVYRQHLVFQGCPVEQHNGLVYWFRIISVAAFSLLVLLETAYAVTFVVMVGFLMVYDTHLYWVRLRKQMIRLVRGFAHLEGSRESLHSSLAESASRAPHKQLQLYKHHRYRWNSEGKQEMKIRLLRYQIKIQLGRALMELRACIIDFFHQIRLSNQFIGILITFVICIWLWFNVVFTLTGIQTGKSVDVFSQIIVRVFQCVGLIAALIVFWPMLEMRKKIESGYVVLCSLMAFETGPVKMDISKMLLFYTYKPSYAFTCFESKIFSRLTLMQVLSYTLTFITVVENFQLAKFSHRMN